MKKSSWYVILIVCIVVISGIFVWRNETGRSPVKKKTEAVIKFDDTRDLDWGDDFKVVEIKSHPDGYIHKAYFYPAKSKEPRPLIVSLHTWSGDFTQQDSIANLCLLNDINYIHPDFRGANHTKDACCSCLALEDIDDAITYAIEKGNVDPEQVYVLGVSGGGYATLSCFMKSKHKIRKFSSWVPISDLIAWYHESRIRENKYADDILGCTHSENGVLNEQVATEKSPIYWETPVEKLSGSELSIYAGVYDGIQGSVPITHSINFYNKVLADLSVPDSSKYVSDKEKLLLLEHRKSLGEFGKIGDRDIFLKKEYKNVKLVIFKGRHEMLTGFAFNELIDN